MIEATHEQKPIDRLATIIDTVFSETERKGAASKLAYDTTIAVRTLLRDHHLLWQEPRFLDAVPDDPTEQHALDEPGNILLYAEIERIKPSIHTKALTMLQKLQGIGTEPEELLRTFLMPSYNEHTAEGVELSIQTIVGNIFLLYAMETRNAFEAHLHRIHA